MKNRISMTLALLMAERTMFVPPRYTTMQRLSLYDGEGGAGAGAGAGAGEGAGAGAGAGAGEGAGEVKDPKAVLQKNQELLGEVKRLKEIHKAFEGIDPQAARKAMESVARAEEEKRKAAGDFEGIKRQMQDQHKAELEKITKERQELEGALYKAVADNQLTLALKDQGNPVLLLPHMRPFVKVAKDENDGEYKAFVVGKDGKPRVKDGAGTPFTIGDLITEFRGQDSFADAFYIQNVSGAGSGGAGAGARGAVRGGPNQIIVPIADEKNPQKYREYRQRAEKEGKQLVLESQMRQAT